MILEQEQQHVAVVDPGKCISFLFPRCCPRYAAAAARAYTAALRNLLINNLLLLINYDLS